MKITSIFWACCFFVLAFIFGSYVGDAIVGEIKIYRCEKELPRNQQCILIAVVKESV